jgi:aspartyl-tRNA(Asn)/glutamyl-tRNA(Gln) amidotransferase subunit C
VILCKFGGNMAIDKETVEYVSRLAKIRLNEKELAEYTNQLDAILNHIKLLESVDTKNIEPQYGILQTVMREDKIADSLEHSQVLQNAPDVEDGYIKVKPILE